MNAWACSGHNDEKEVHKQEKGVQVDSGAHEPFKIARGYTSMGWWP